MSWVSPNILASVTLIDISAEFRSLNYLQNLSLLEELLRGESADDGETVKTCYYCEYLPGLYNET